MTTKGKSPSKKVGMVGCGTQEIMFRDAARKFFGAIDGVVGVSVRRDKVVVLVRDESVKAKLPKQFRRRPVEAVVTGPIKAGPAKGGSARKRTKKS